jgi:hypothetical protein
VKNFRRWYPKVVSVVVVTRVADLADPDLADPVRADLGAEAPKDDAVEATPPNSSHACLKSVM